MTVTVDQMLRDPDRIARTLRRMDDERRMSEGLFPRPIMSRIADRAADRRAGRSVRRYRGDHRTGHHTVAELAAEVAAGDTARRTSHRRALRRPFDPSPVYLGERWQQIRLYVPGDPGDAATIVGTLEPSEDWVLSVPVLQGPPGAPIEDIAEADTGPLVWQPAVAMLADMFEPWPSLPAG